jgi:translation initiation factor 4G
MGSTRGKGGSSQRMNKSGSHRNDERDQKTMPLTAGQELKPLEVGKSGWKPTSVGMGPGSSQPLPGGRLPPDIVQRKVKAALNKMTPEKFDRIADSILEISAQSKDETDGRTLRQVIALTFEKACDEAHWAQMYAKFCKRMLETMSTDIRDENVTDKSGNPIVGGALFRKYLLNRCQHEFERGWEVNLPARPEGQTEEAALLSDEYYVAAAAKRRGLGLVQFIGELYKLSMLTIRIMHECVHKLLNFEGLPSESTVESFVKLLRTIGETMEATETGPGMLNMYFSRIDTILKMPNLPSRLRFMLMDTIDLRKNNWQSKNEQRGPKTITEIREEAAMAQQQAELERQRQHARGGRPQMGRGDARNFSGGNSMPPPDFSRNTVGMDDLRRLGRGQSGRNVSQTQTTFGPVSLLGSRSNSGRSRLGPGGMSRPGDDSGNSSRTGTPPVKDKEATTHANQFSALASLDASGEGADGDAASPPSAANSPPASKSKPTESSSLSKTVMSSADDGKDGSAGQEKANGNASASSTAAAATS